MLNKLDSQTVTYIIVGIGALLCLMIYVITHAGSLEKRLVKPDEFKKEKLLIKTIEDEIDRIERTGIYGKIDTIEEDLLEETEKVKYLIGDSEEEINKKWKEFKSKKDRFSSIEGFAGDIASISKKKIKFIDNKYQINVFYRELEIVKGKENEYHALEKEVIPNILRLEMLEDLLEDLEEGKKSVDDIKITDVQVGPPLAQL